jgi:hypothetical protein
MGGVEILRDGINGKGTSHYLLLVEVIFIILYISCGLWAVHMFELKLWNSNSLICTLL